jgi:O-antigen/teichoic acid export membrane protein
VSVRDWFRDRALRRVARFGVPVTIGKAITSVASLVTLALLARQLGVEQFGVLALIRSIVGATDQFANFNTWQAIVKYGAEAIALRRVDDVKRVIKLAIVIDIASALVAAAVIAVIAFALAGAFGFTTHQSLACALYAITVVTRVAGATDGIFRICDAYRGQAIATSLGAAISIVAIAVAVALDAGFDGCAIALAASEIAGNVIVTIVALDVARDSGYGGWWKTPLAGVRSACPGIVHFLVATNGQLTVKKAQTELDMIVVGAMLGKIPSGLFKVVKQLGTIPGRIFMPFEQVLFTELARLAAANDYASFARLLRRSAAAATLGSLAIWAVAALVAAPLVEIVAGADYVAAAEPFRWYLLAMVLTVANAPIQRATIALGRPGTLFVFDLATLAVLIAFAIAGAYAWGLVGVSLAILGYKLIQIAWSTWLVARIIRQRQSSVGDLPRSPTPP